MSLDGSPLTHGGSATQFMLRLPGDAACPGDTEHHGYLVFSYVTPSTAAPANLTFPGGYPSSGLDLITVRGEPYKAQPTAVISGSIIQPPAFVWSRYDHHPDVLPAGTYNVGIACAHQYGQVVSYWNTQVAIVASSTDPGGFTWQAVGLHAAGGGGSSHRGLIIGLAVAGVLLVAAGVVMARRKRAGHGAPGQPLRHPSR
jgi:hypothetical protein